MEFKTDYRAERYALDAKWDDFPAAVQEHAVMCGVDLMTALILGSYGEQFKAGQKLEHGAAGRHPRRRLGQEV